MRIDRGKILQVLHNLVQNATEALEDQDQRLVRIWLKQGSGGWEVHVRDNGPGITDAQRVFQARYTSKAFGGGMGLALSRQIVRVHEGRPVARRPTDGGTELVLTLKPAAVDAP